MRTYRQAQLIQDGSDLPLFSGTAQRIEEPEPAAAASPWRQASFLETPGMGELAEEISKASKPSLVLCKVSHATETLF